MSKLRPRRVGLGSISIVSLNIVVFVINHWNEVDWTHKNDISFETIGKKLSTCKNSTWRFLVWIQVR